MTANPGNNRARLATWLLVAGGVAVMVSTLLPWVGALGIISANLDTGAAVYLAVVGLIYIALGLVALRGRRTAIIVTLWVINAVMAISVLSMFGSFSVNGNDVISPGPGVYVSSLGVLAGLVGTIVLHGAPAQRRTTWMPPPYAQWLWDGSQWLPPVVFSPDGRYRWDGQAWVAVAPPSPRGIDPPPPASE
jgi:hypothetical protein